MCFKEVESLRSQVALLMQRGWVSEAASVFLFSSSGESEKTVLGSEELAEEDECNDGKFLL